MKNQNFKIESLNTVKIQDLDGWKEKQQNVLKTHPFVQICDSETYKIAKKSRTALRSARTEIQNQDKTIGKCISSFRKRTIELCEDLINITLGSEKKQQLEIDRWETILEQKKNLEKQIEEKRISDIKKNINSFENECSIIIKNLTFENLNDKQKVFDDFVETAMMEEFEEYHVLFVEKVSLLNESFESKKQSLIDNQEMKIQAYKNELTIRIQKIEIGLNHVINNATINADNLINEVQETLNDFELDFETGEGKEMFQKMRLRITDLAEMKNSQLIIDRKEKEKMDLLIESEKRNKKINDQRSNVQRMKNGYLDLIHQMNVKNFIEEGERIKTIISQKQNLVVEVQNDFEEMIQMIDEKFKTRLNELRNEKLKIQQMAKLRMENLTHYGFEMDLINQKMSGHGIVLSFEEIEDSSDWENVLKRIESNIEFSKQVKIKKERLFVDKNDAIDKMQQFKNSFPFDHKFKNDEINLFWKGLEIQFNEFMDEMTESLKEI